MKGYHQNIEKLTLENDNFRKVEYTSAHMQLVLMTLNPLEEIGLETHEENDQFFRCEAGMGTCIIDDHEYTLTDGDSVVIPAGASHNIINTSPTEKLRVYTIYAKPHHLDQTIHPTKKDAEMSTEEFDGKTTE
jgi:mannose-6-phosphate isomerase-like protein (cupin superfamily)